MYSSTAANSHTAKHRKFLLPAIMICFLGACSADDPQLGNAGTDDTDADHNSLSGRMVYSLDKLLQLGSLGNHILLTQKSVCNNGGRQSITHLDPDEDGTLSVDDEVTAVFENCIVSVVEGLVNGQVNLKVLAGTESGKENKLAVTTSALQMGPSPVEADLVLTRAGDTFGSILSIESAGTVRIDYTRYATVNIHNATLTRSEDYQTALWQIQAKAGIDFSDTGESIQLITNSPLQGYFGEFPHQGEFQLQTDSGIETMTANYIENSESYSSTVQGNSANYPWRQHVDGAFWGLKGLVGTRFTQTFKLENLKPIGIINDDEMRSFAPEGTLYYLMSRPVAYLEAWDATFHGRHYGHIVEASVTAYGAMLEVRPLEPLHRGRNYFTPRFDVWSAYDTAHGVGEDEITVAGTAQP